MDERRGPTSNLPVGLSGALAPEPWPPLPVCYGNDYNAEFIRSKDDVERKSAKYRPAEVHIEDLKRVWRNRDQINHAIQLIQKADCGSNASPGVPGGSFLSVLQRCRMEADRPSHQRSKWGTEPTTSLVPSDSLNAAGIEIPNPLRNLASPYLFGVLVDLCVKAVDERIGKCRPCFRG